MARPHPITKAERSETTRAALIGAGRALFAERGFAGTATEAIVERAGVTRGALYHHFRDKSDLFQAVYEELEQELVGAAVVALDGVTDPLEALRVGAEGFLDACLDPAVQRVVLQEGPTVLGWEHWRELDQAYGLGLVTAALQVAVDAGVIRPLPVETLAHVLMAGLTEAAILLAHAPDPSAARKDAGLVVRALIDGLST
jgi:AcrR family transcriptional regulator